MTEDRSPSSLSRSEIAGRLRRAGEMLRLRGESHYRAGAYERGAAALETLEGDLTTLVMEGRLTEIRGLGPSLAATISELVRDGASATLDRIMGDLPVGLLHLARLPGLTLPRIQRLYDELGISGIEDLRQALAAGAVETLKGFGPQTATRLRAALEDAERPPERVLLVDALAWAERMVGHVRQAPGVRAAEIVGSIRRWVETVGDVNLLAAAETPEGALSALTSHPAVATTISRDAWSCKVRLSNGLAVTLTVEVPTRFASALVWATGSRKHCDRLRARALARGLNPEDRGREGSDDEAALYAALGLPFIPPELREDAGEIEAADTGDRFLDLVEERDIRGMVHCHTTYSDGRNTIAEMARAAEGMGMTYLTITDHSPTASYAGGVTPDTLPRQWREIAEAQAGVSVKLLRGTESDILRDGNLDYGDDILGSLDVIIASIHERHKMDSGAMTERLVRAMQQPVFKIWGHGLGRLLLRRDAIACDVERVLDAVAASPAAIELNGSPHRMDLPAEWTRSARRRGIKFVISTDAHSTAELDNLRFGVGLARRGGLRRSDILNTLPAAAFAEAVRPREGQARSPDRK